MTFSKYIKNRVISMTLASALAISTAMTAGVPALATEGEPTETMTAGTSTSEAKADPTVAKAATPSAPKRQVKTDPNTGNAIQPHPFETEAYKPTVRKQNRLMATAGGQRTIDASDLSTWTVFTNYYNPNWTYTKVLTDPDPAYGSWYIYTAPKPANWDTTVNAQGQHPFLVWNEDQLYSNNNVYYDLDDPQQIALMEATNMQGAYSSHVAHFSKHIYTTGTANDATITFLGYGTSPFTDFALAPVTESGMKSVGFDIDANAIDSHTLNSYGILFNAGIGADGILKGYFLDFSVYYGVKLYDLSEGIDANKLHNGYQLQEYQEYEQWAYDPETGEYLLDDDGNYITQTITYGRPSTPIPEFAGYQAVGRSRVDLDIRGNSVKVSIAPYDAVGNLGDPVIANIALPTVTNYNNYGPYVNYGSHGCSSLSYIKFSKMQMSVNYDIVFDANGGTFANGTDADRINGIEPGKSIRDMGLSLPAAPTRPGYSFLGWYTTVDGSNDNFDESTPINRITTAVAQWSVNPVVTFVSGGNGSVSGKTSESVTPGQAVTVTPGVTPDMNYKFSHWVDDSGKQYQTADLKNILPTKNMTITAIFVLNGVKIDYVAGANGSLSGTTSHPGAVLNQPLPAAPTTTPAAGYVFDNWTNSAGTIVTPGSTLVTKADTITANFTRDENNDGVADKTQTRFNVTLDVKGPGSFGATDKRAFDVIERQHTGKAPLSDALGGFTEPKLIPNTASDPTAKFWWWEDAAGQKIADLKQYSVEKSCKVYAFFDTDDDHDGTPDSLQQKFGVKFEVRGKGSLTGKLAFTVYGVNGTVAGLPSASAPLSAAIGGFAAPTPVPADKLTCFYRWEDAAGNEITSLPNQVISGNTTIYARFEADINADGIPDILQNKYTVTFVGTQGATLKGTTSYTFIGGKKGDNVPLTDKNVVNGPYAVPTVSNANAELIAKGWSSSVMGISSTPGVGMSPTALRLTSDVTFSTDFDTKTYDVKFVLNGTVLETRNLPKGAAIGTQPSNAVTRLGTNYNIDYWQSQSGTNYTAAQLTSGTVTGDMTLTAKYSLSKALGKR